MTKKHIILDVRRARQKVAQWLSSPFPGEREPYSWHILADTSHRQAIDAAVAAMPPMTRSIFVARMADGLTFREIARREGLFLWQVRRHMRRAIRLIAQSSQ